MAEGDRINKGFVTMAPAVTIQPEAAPSPAHWEVSPSPQACTPPGRQERPEGGRKPGYKGAANGGQQHAVASQGLLAAAEVSGTTGD